MIKNYIKNLYKNYKIIAIIINFLRADLFKYFFKKTKNNKLRRFITILFSLKCKLFGKKSVLGKISTFDIYISTSDVWGLMKFYFKTNYDCENIENLKKILLKRKDYIFWDIGANYGAYSLILNKYTHKTIAIEPFPKTISNLQKTLFRSKDKVFIVNCAAGEKNHTSELYVSKRHFGDHRLYQPGNEKSRCKKSVNIRTLDDIYDDYSKQLSPYNIIKIDVQGSEYNVLKGAKNLIDNSLELFVFLEIWKEGLEGMGSSLENLFSLCKANNLYPIDNFSYKPLTWDIVINKYKDVDRYYVGNLMLKKLTN